MRAKNNIKITTHAWAISHARSARPPGRPDERHEELVSGPGKQPSWAASGSKPTTGAVDLSAGAADPRGCVVCCCWCLLLLVLPLLCCCFCCFDDDCSCFSTFGHISYWYDNSRASYCFYLSAQPPAPASSLAEQPPAASPQLGRWICQQGLRSARIRGLLLVLAAASAAGADAAGAAAAASTTTALAFLRLVTFRTG